MYFWHPSYAGDQNETRLIKFFVGSCKIIKGYRSVSWNISFHQISELKVVSVKYTFIGKSSENIGVTFSDYYRRLLWSIIEHDNKWV